MISTAILHVQGTDAEASSRTLQPAGWPKPKGYSNGILAQGRMIFVGGQIGWNERGEFAKDFTDQVRQALANIVAVLAEGGAAPGDLVRLTWYVVDMEEYLGALADIGRVYREIIGAHYPTMAMVQVVRLVEPDARVEIEATAVMPA